MNHPALDLLTSTFIHLVNESLPTADLAEVHNGTELDLFLDPNDLLAEAYEKATGHAMNYRSTDEPLNQLLSQTIEAAAAQRYLPQDPTVAMRDSFRQSAAEHPDNPFIAMHLAALESCCEQDQ
jgi:hypothetical protein